MVLTKANDLVKLTNWAWIKLVVRASLRAPPASKELDVTLKNWVFGVPVTTFLPSNNSKRVLKLWMKWLVAPVVIEGAKILKNLHSRFANQPLSEASVQISNVYTRLHCLYIWKPRPKSTVFCIYWYVGKANAKQKGVVVWLGLQEV